MEIKSPILGLCQQANFILSADKPNEYPNDHGFEVSFIGRSNAGKSSVLNTLTRSHLAYTSKTPGRTKLINFFRLDHERRLVDFPGYGYAKVGRTKKKDWQENLEAYLSKRQSLKGIILIADIRHPMSNFYETILRWAVYSNMPVHVLLNKADKLGPIKSRNEFFKVKIELNKKWGDLVSLQIFSASKRIGLLEAYAVIADWMEISFDKEERS